MHGPIEAILDDDVPMLLVRGQVSDLVSEDRAEEFLARFPQIEFVDVARCRTHGGRRSQRSVRRGGRRLPQPARGSLAIPYDQRMRGSKILITGPSGQVAAPIAKALAADNEVWGIARFSDPRRAKAWRRRACGARPSTWPRVTSAACRPTSTTCSTSRWPRAADGTRTSRANAEAAGLLMAHCRTAKAFLHCSLGGGLRSARRRTPHRARRPRRQPQADVPRRIPSRRSPARPSSGRWRAPSDVPATSPASTCPTATTAAGRSSTWR